MSHRRTNVVGGGATSVTILPWEHPVVWEFVGKGRYLQAAFCKSAAQLYSAKFGSFTLKSLSSIAAEGKFIGLVAWSKEIGCCWDESVFMSGAKGGNVPLLECLRINDCPIPRDVSLCTTAGTGGHLEALDFLRQKCGCIWGEGFCGLVAGEGRLEILQYAHARQSECRKGDRPGWDSHRVCRFAAREGHIHILEWAQQLLHEDGLFDARTCEAAAWGGKLDVLQYLRGVGCDWDGSTCRAAMTYGHVGVLKWALDNGCPWAVNDRDSFGGTSLHYARDVKMIEFLISLGADINAADDNGKTPLHSQVFDGDLESLQILVRAGADVNVADIDGRTPLDTAIARRPMEIVEFLRAAGARESA